MIPLAVPNLQGNEELYLRQCVDSTFVSSIGPFVDRFEKMTAELSGAAYAIATSSGTAGLHAALKAVGVEKDDLVVLPSFTFVGSANAIHQCAASPWLFDISPDSWTLDSIQVLDGLRKQTTVSGDALIHQPTGRRVAAIMPVHTLGHPANMEELRKVAAQYNLPIVADGAASLGARLDGKMIGELAADLTVFSFNGNKTFTAGAGGAVVGQDQQLCDRVRHLTTTAKSSPFYDHDEAGFNYRMSNIQAAVGCAQLECFDNFLSAKRAISERYNQALSGLFDVEFFPEKENTVSAKWFSGIVLPPEVEPLDRILDFLKAKGIDAKPFWKPMHLQKPYRNCPKQDMSCTDHLWHRILTLPCSTGLPESDQDYVINQVIKVLNG